LFGTLLLPHPLTLQGEPFRENLSGRTLQGEPPSPDFIEKPLLIDEELSWLERGIKGVSTALN
jgi:hypothetical protein